MLRTVGISLMALAIGTLATGAGAQTRPAQTTPTPTPSPTTAAPEENDGAGPDIVVNGHITPPGSVVGDITPEQVLSPADIRSYGVSSLNDLLTELAPETQSGRGSGPPVVLLNGKRISSFAEIRDIPTEAISRVDILPEEVALKYGYRADQKVVNVVLRKRFRALTIEPSDTIATDGGRNTPKIELDGLKIANDNRVNVDMTYQSSDRLRESDRNLTSRSGTTSVTPTPGFGSSDDMRAFRTLLPSSQTFSLNTVYSRPIGKVSATVNGRVQIDTTLAELGLPGVSLNLPATDPFNTTGQPTTLNGYTDLFGALTQSTETIATHLGAGFNGDISPKWRWNLTANYDRSYNETFTQTGLDTSTAQARLNAGDPSFNPLAPFDRGLFSAAPDTRAYSTSNALGADALINGQLLTLPAGPINTAFRAGAQTTSFDSRSVRFGTTQTGRVKRDIVNGQFNIDVPLTSRRTKFLDAIGDLSLNGNIAADHLSDFGTLWTYGYGANWSPTPSLRILVSATDQAVAPTPQQLGNPLITTPNVRVFDYVLGQSANITRVDGGNPNLVSSERHVLKIGGTFKPSVKTDLTFIANYVKTGTTNPIESFPADTPEIEAAYPGRFTRDSNGALTRVDARPVNFLREDTSQLRYGFNLSLPLKSHIEKAFAAYREGTGPNPFAGLQGVFGNRRGGPGGRGADGQRGQGQQGQAGAERRRRQSPRAAARWHAIGLALVQRHAAARPGCRGAAPWRFWRWSRFRRWRARRTRWLRQSPRWASGRAAAVRGVSHLAIHRSGDRGERVAADRPAQWRRDRDQRRPAAASGGGAGRVQQ